jgi:peptidoglycan/LPS O-acetylase OafA/YrhL
MSSRSSLSRTDAALEPRTALTPRESLGLKGLACLAIALHNVSVDLAPDVSAQEFHFVEGAAAGAAAILAAKPADALFTLAAFFGHYASPVFVFLSVFGVAASLAVRPRGWRRFMGERVRALYFPFLAAGVVWLAVTSALYGLDHTIATQGKQALAQLALISPFAGLGPFKPVSPWWFVSLAFQLYLVVPTLVQARRRLGPRLSLALAAVGVASNLFLFDAFVYHRQNLLFTPLGHLPVIAAALELAFRESALRLSWPLAFAAAAVFAAAQVNPWAWRLGEPAAVALALALGLAVVRRWPAPLAALGGISLWVFLLHGIFVRPFTDAVRLALGSQAALALFMGTSLLAAYGAARLHARLSARASAASRSDQDDRPRSGRPTTGRPPITPLQVATITADLPRPEENPTTSR